MEGITLLVIILIYVCLFGNISNTTFGWLVRCRGPGLLFAAQRSQRVYSLVAQGS